MSTNYEMLLGLSQKQMSSFIRSLITKEASKYIDWNAWLGSEDPEPPYIGRPAFVNAEETENPCMMLEETETDGHLYRTIYRLLPKGMVEKETLPAYQVRLEDEDEYPEYFEIEEPAAEEPEVPVQEEPVTEEPAVEEPQAEAPAAEEAPAEEEYIPRHARSEAPAVQDEEPVIEEPVTEEPVTEEPVIEEPAAEEPEDLLDDFLLDELSGAIAQAEENENTVTMRLQKIDEEEEERAREAAVFALDFDEKELEEIPVLTEDSEPAEEAAPEEPVLIEETPAEEPEDDDDDELVLPEPDPQERKTDTHTFTAPLLADDPRVEEDDDDDIERLSELVNELTGSYDIVSETSMDEDDDDDDDEEDGHVIGELLSSLKEKSELFDPENPEDLELPTIAFTSVVED